MAKLKCEKCGNAFTSKNEETLFCPDFKRGKCTKLYEWIAIIIMVMGFFGGIILGETYPKVVAETYKYLSDIRYDESFNYAIMLYVWIGTFLFDVFIMAIHSVCYRLDLLIDQKVK